MNNIVAFGDSYTFGHGLEDCWVKNGNDYGPGRVCSEHAWPSILAKDLGYNVINHSEPGLSNLAILHSILNTKFSDNSICIIMWSYPFRDMIFGSKYLPTLELFNKKIEHTHRVTHVGNWMRDELSKNWILTHNNTDLIMRTWLHIHHANLYLDSLNVPHYNFFVGYQTIKNHKPDYVKILSKDILVDEFLDYALDNDHPGPLTHIKMSNDIKQCLTEASII